MPGMGGRNRGHAKGVGTRREQTVQAAEDAAGMRSGAGGAGYQSRAL
jgi:hypothetical protein